MATATKTNQFPAFLNAPAYAKFKDELEMRLERAELKRSDLRSAKKRTIERQKADKVIFECWQSWIGSPSMMWKGRILETLGITYSIFDRAIFETSKRIKTF